MFHFLDCSEFQISPEGEVSWSVPGEGLEEDEEGQRLHTLFECALGKCDSRVVPEEVSAGFDSSHEEFWSIHIFI